MVADTPIKTFKMNIEKARIATGGALLREIKILLDRMGVRERFKMSRKEFIRNFPILERIAPITQAFDNFFEDFILPMVEHAVKSLYELGMPQTLVYSVSCLEAYLKDRYFSLQGSKDKHSERAFQNVAFIRRVYCELIHGDIFEGNESLRLDVQEVLQIRHVFVHRGGVIDKMACERCEKWQSPMIGEEIRLNSSNVDNYINKIVTFAELVQKKTNMVPPKV